MKLRNWTTGLLLCLALGATARAQEPFGVEARLGPITNGEAELTVAVTVPPEHYLYAEMMAIECPDGQDLEPVELPKSKKKMDPFLNQEVEVFDGDLAYRYKVKGLEADKPLQLSVSLQGCNQTFCFRPTTVDYELRPEGEPKAPSAEPATQTKAAEAPSEAPANPEGQEWAAQIGDFKVAGKEVGYMKPEAFLAFLERAETGSTQGALDLEKYGFVSLILIVLIGGLLLNLTPCVLPMIPINLAIIGAGTRAGSRLRGFALGGVYGLAIATTYGLLGVVVVATGSQFGALNASAWFNIAIALVFIVLALAMFDVITIDFSRFRKAGGAGGSRAGQIVPIFAMGCVAALLAGACVAPVLIAVLLLASNLVADGNYWGYALPFLLGAGMALPWPIAGAGLSFLPKPGAWMTKVKYAFGVLILLFAVYYGHLGYTLARGRLSLDEARALAAAQERHASQGGWHTTLAPALSEARKQNKPIFIDFWATWCKNCLAMDGTTFQDEAVVKRLDDFVKVKIQAERFDDPGVKGLVDRFGLVGLPTYIVLKP